MAKPNSRATLIKYCKRALGAPVIEINIDDDQIDDRIDEALQFYQHYHTDATEKVFLKHQVTQTDIDNEYIPITEVVTDVVRVLPISQSSSISADMFDVKYQMHLNDMYKLGYMGNILEYVQTQQHMSTVDLLINSDDKRISFNRHRDRLDIVMDWSNEVSVGNFIVIEAYRIVDPDTFTDVYNDYYLKKYATALIKKQWGANLIKFEGMVMPGGVTFNGRQIFDDAVEELLKLEEEVRLNWEQPVDFYVG
tara:strand:+ start:848 stop:1600 length:753 start_codon:yes stop_codon:yes gene_type:complete